MMKYLGSRSGVGRSVMSVKSGRMRRSTKGDVGAGGGCVGGSGERKTGRV